MASSIAVGDKAIAQNAGAVAIVKMPERKCRAISIGKDSDVTSIDGVALPEEKSLRSQSSIAIGETNTIRCSILCHRVGQHYRR